MTLKKLTLVLGILVAGNILLAQENEQSKEKRQARIEDYKERLNLSDMQVEKVKEIRAKYKPEMQKIRHNDEMSQSDKMRASADVLDKIDADMVGVLTADQQEEWKEIKKELQENWERHREQKRERKKG